jgi:hypothetical protein
VKTGTPSFSVVPRVVPTLAEVQADPGCLDNLPLNVLVILRRQVRHLDADVEAAVFRQLDQAQREPATGTVLDVKTAAKRLGTSSDSLYRKRKRLRLGYVDPLDGRLKFTEQEITNHIDRQKRG